MVERQLSNLKDNLKHFSIILKRLRYYTILQNRLMNDEVLTISAKKLSEDYCPEEVEKALNWLYRSNFKISASSVTDFIESEKEKVIHKHEEPPPLTDKQHEELRNLISETIKKLDEMKKDEEDSESKRREEERRIFLKKKEKIKEEARKINLIE